MPRKLKLTIIFLSLLLFTIRLYANFSSEYVAGLNGAYYLVQVRQILEDGRLMFSDFPLVFYLEALIAKSFTFIFSQEKSISLAQ